LKVISNDSNFDPIYKSLNSDTCQSNFNQIYSKSGTQIILHVTQSRWQQTQIIWCGFR